MQPQPQAYAKQVAEYSAMWPQVAELAPFARLQWPAQNPGTELPRYDAWRNAITAHAVALVRLKTSSSTGMRTVRATEPNTERLSLIA